MRLSTEVIGKLRSDYTLRSKIGLLAEKHPATIQKWVDANSYNGPLTTWAVLAFLAQEMNMKINEMVVDDSPVIPKHITR